MSSASRTIPSVNKVISSSCGDFTTATRNSWVDVTNLNLTITTEKKNGFDIKLIADNDDSTFWSHGNGLYIENGAYGQNALVRFIETNTGQVLSSFKCQLWNSAGGSEKMNWLPGSFSGFFDNNTTGSFNIKVQIFIDSTTTANVGFYKSKLLVIEL